MSKFKIGDWVRRINYDFGSVKVGDIGVVQEFDDGVLRLVGDWHNYMSSNFEPWVPKVGERVRVADNTIFRSGTPIGCEGLVKNTTNLLSLLVSITHPRDGLIDQYCGAADLEPLPVAAPQPALAITAGKFYRTRDGRKVGPIKSAFHWLYADINGTSQPFFEDGTHGSGLQPNEPWLDLIAGWQETTNVGAQVDTLAEEYGPAVRTAAASNDNAAKPKFKVGDKIMNPRGWHRYYPVSRVLRDEVEIDVDGTKLKYDIAGVDWLVQPATTPTTTAIVALIEDGKPKPADIPHVHANQAAAEREAKRLAGVHKGKQFGVYVLATTAEEPEPVYAHEWQRLAKSGKKGDATKLLRNLSGLSLSSSQLAVEDWLKKAA